MDSSLSLPRPSKDARCTGMMISSFHQSAVRDMTGRPSRTGAPPLMLSSAQAPLYEIKANLFKGLAHPARIRILELLAAAPQESAPVSYLLAETGLEASHLSQHLATLRK